MEQSGLVSSTRRQSCCKEDGGSQCCLFGQAPDEKLDAVRPGQHIIGRVTRSRVNQGAIVLVVCDS
jgi:hypothetical protein